MALGHGLSNSTHEFEQNRCQVKNLLFFIQLKIISPIVGAIEWQKEEQIEGHKKAKLK